MARSILPESFTPSAAEASVLGGVLIHPELLEQLGDLHVEHFADIRHRAVYGAMLALRAAGTAIDVTTIENQLAQAQQVEAVGGVTFLGELALRVPTPDNAREYADMVRESWRNRQALEMLERARMSILTGFYPAAEVLDETAAALARFHERVPARKSTRRTYHTVEQVAEGMRSFAKLPWIPFRIGGETIDELPLGEACYLMGPTGSGKTTLALNMAMSHAEHIGPVIIVSRELREETAGARVGSMRSGTRWADVLRGPATEQAITALLELPRMVFLDDERATFECLQKAIDECKIDFPGQPIMVLADYIQIMQASSAGRAGDLRQRASEAVDEMRNLLKRNLVVGLVLSQMSRNASSEAKRGNRLGADSDGGGAETSAIERAAAMQLEIGYKTPIAEDGSTDVQLSISKMRYGGGDRVVELRQWGASGLTRVLRDEPAEVVRERAKEAKATATATSRKREAEELIMASADRFPRPFTREELLSDAGLTGGARKAAGRSVLAALIASGALVELPERRHGAKYPNLWTRDRPLPEPAKHG